MSNRWFYQDLIFYIIFFLNTNYTLFDYFCLNFVLTTIRFFAIQVYNAYLLKPPLGPPSSKTLYMYIQFKYYSKSILIWRIGGYLDEIGVQPRWWRNQIFILSVLIDLLTLFFLFSWAILYTFLVIITFPIAFDKGYLYCNIVLTFKAFIVRYIIIFFEIPSTFKVRYKISDVVGLFFFDGAPYLKQRGILFSVNGGWVLSPLIYLDK